MLLNRDFINFLLRRKYVIVFILSLIIRSIFILVFPLSSYGFFPTDSHEYAELANRLLAGNYNFDIGRFVRSPFYPFFIALHKVLFQNNWEFALIISQLLLSCFTGILLCKIAQQLFDRPPITLITGIIYAVYFPIFYYVYSFTTETVYLFFNILSMYFLQKMLADNKLRNVICFAAAFSLAYLTRSEIILFSPFIFLLILYHNRQKLWSGLKSFGLIIIIWFVISLPWMLVNFHIHNTYIFSSNGGKYVFYLANSELGYTDIANTPPLGSREFRELINNYNYFNPGYDSIVALPQNIKQNIFLEKSFEWIRDNPEKFLKAKLFNLLNFLSPGLTINHHGFRIWLLMFVLTLPLHLLFYVGFIKALKESFSSHLWFAMYFLSVCGFLTLFLYTTRFRTYSIEPYYIIYASYALFQLKPVKSVFERFSVL